VETDNGPSIDPEVRNDLLARARAAAESAYAPYSGFPVGAAALAIDGSIHTGGNIENASYGLTICAERAAVCAAIGAGHREIIAIAVSAPKVPRTTPCGACRQFLNEFRPANTDMAIILDDRGSGDPVLLGELLPQAFGPRHLKTALQADDARSLTRQDEHGG
jgi:cytidine deaminase